MSLGGFWAPATDVVGQPATLGMNAEFARVATPIVPPKEGSPLWIGIGRFGRLELSGDAMLPDSGQSVPDQLWIIETGVTHIRPLDSGGTLGGTFLFGSASDRPFAAGRDLTLMALASWMFDRELFQGTNFTSGRTDVVEFDPGPGLSIQLMWRR